MAHFLPLGPLSYLPVIPHLSLIIPLFIFFFPLFCLFPLQFSLVDCQIFDEMAKY